ncbi:MAG: DNA-binding response regulator [Thiogranum sp.]
MNYLNTASTEPADITDIKHDTGPDKTSIFIIGHQDFFLDSLISMLKSQGSDYLVSCIESTDACMEKLAGAVPDVLLIQNDVLREPIEQFVHSILETYPGIRFLVFGKTMDDDYLYRLVRCGIHGYINERMSGDHIRHALGSVIAGKTWIERHIMERFISTQRDLDEAMESQFYTKIDQLCSNLTRREIEILGEVVKGLAIKQIAEEVHLSHQGVKMHLAKLFRKFRVSNRNQLILAAFDEISPVKDLSILLRDGLSNHMELSR